ncbi:uncharacterized protein LOC134829621 [Culicoides brevitarsis]|uniref:uncharacterized protein LOC134829621 n=1 Tax=Culicoides brevitarsis TaxID=469753 RepID=UPI00307C43A2
MNPVVETLVIETVVETAPIIADCDDFQCVAEEDDPLSDPLSTNDTPEKDEFPSINDEEDDESQTTDKEKDQTIRLVNVKELTDSKIEISCETKALPVKRPEPQPSCSKASEPNFEFDDLEDLIESSRIETSFNKKKFQEEPRPSTSSALTSGDETWKLQEIIDETSIASSVDSDITSNDAPLEAENAELVDDEEKKSRFDDETSVSSFLLEDFEDQITQNVVNKSNVSQSSSQIEQIESSLDEEPELTQTKDAKEQVEVTVISEDMKEKPEIETKEEEQEEKQTQPVEILPEVDKISSEVAVTDESKPENEAKVVMTEKPEIVIPEPCMTEQKETSESFQVIEVTSEIVPDQVNLSCPSSSSNVINTREVEDSLAVIVEAVDLIQSTSTDVNKPVPSSSTGETTRDEEDGGLRSDGSDSGLGSEPSHNGSALLDKSLSATATTKLPDPPAKGNLKRRSSEQIDTCSEIGTKRSKKGIQFEGVTVYSFPRQQGFSCVPSQGGCTLGMANQHCGVKYYTLTEHSAEQRRNHRQQLAEMNPRSSSSDDSDSEYEPTDSSSEADSEVYGFLQPVSARQRRALLKSAGVRKIDTTEKDDCKMIRTSREVCGCTCRVYCDPDTCACSLAGIKCQVDRPNFPCGCTREGCGNVVGRVEFSPMRVRTHYIHTVMRLQMENKSERLRSSTNAASTASSNNYKAWQQQQQQQQSNVRQLPSSSSNSSGNACSVDGRAIDETQQQQQQHCDFSLIYDNHSSINTEIVPSSNAASPAYSSYQSDTTSSYVNHIIEYVPKPSTSYATNANYDPNNAYMTSYVEPQSQQQQPQQQQYLEVVSYDTMQTPTYQLHSYDHHSYAMPPQQMNYATYHHHPYPTSTAASSYIAYPNSTSNGYLQSHIQLCDQPMTTTYNPNQTQIVSNTIINATPSTSQQLYETSPAVVVQPNTNVLPVINGKQQFEPTNPNPQQQQQQMVVTANGNTNENLCEIIKKGIVETVSG